MAVNGIFAVLFLAAVLQSLSLVREANGSSMVGRVFCDNCWDGEYNRGQDKPIRHAKVNITCSILQALGRPNNLDVWASGTTDSDGNFRIGLAGSTVEGDVNQIFLSALFLNGDPTLGERSDAYVTGCRVEAEDSKCPVRTFSNGACRTDGIATDGFTSRPTITLTPLSSASADLGFTSDICYAPSQPENKCSTPPGGQGDPHYTGADGSRFDFSGEPNSTFCLLSDAHLHVNVFYGGRYGQWGDNPHKALTWIRKMGVLWGHHTIALEAREGATWQYDTGYMARMEIDGEEVRLSQAGDSIQRAGGDIELRWVTARQRGAVDLADVYDLTVGRVLKIRLTLRPEIAILRTATDGAVHFDFQILRADVSDGVHGVLGQTFRSDHEDRLAAQNLEYSEAVGAEAVPGENAEGFLDGAFAQYRSTALLRADCRFSRFTRATWRDEEAAQGAEISSARPVGAARVKNEEQPVRAWRKRLF